MYQDLQNFLDGFACSTKSNTASETDVVNNVRNERPHSHA